MREIRSHRSMWRELETESRTGLRHRQLAKAVGNSYSPGLRITAPVPDPTEDEESFLGERSVEWIGEVSANLHHPGFVGTRRDSCYFDTTRCELDYEEHIERDKTTRAPDFDGEEVGGSKHVPVSLEKLAPSRSLAALWRRVDSVPLNPDFSDAPCVSMHWIRR